MILTVISLVAVTVAVAALVIVPRLRVEQLVFDVAPDAPSAFGYKMSWIAVRTSDTGRVATALGLTDQRSCNWSSGVGTVYDDKLGENHIFVAPPVDGWTLVVGLSLPTPVKPVFVDKLTPLLLDLGTEFPEVQYYFTYPLVDMFAWVRVRDMKLVRAFAIGDDGVIWNKGRPTAEERALGLKLFELRGVKGRKGDAGGEIVLYPTEDHVLQIARRWSLDPTHLPEMRPEPALGVVGISPASWRTERVRKRA